MVLAKKKSTRSSRPRNKIANKKSIDYDPHAAKRKAFLIAFSQVGVMSKACEAAKCSRASVKRWLQIDPKFNELFEEAKEIAMEELEAEARRRAVAGVRKLVLNKGEMVMVPEDLDNPLSKKIPLIEHQYSDLLMMFLLKAGKPEKYRDHYQLNVNGQVMQYKELKDVSTGDL